MKYFTIDNTNGFDQEQLDKFNDIFPVWAYKNGFNLSDQDHYKSACDAFHDSVMIYG